MPQSHEAGRRHLEVILGQTDRITGIIRSLLDYTRPRHPTLGEEEVPPLLARLADLLQGRYRARGVAEAEIALQERACVEVAVAFARRRNPATKVSVFDLVKDTLLLRYPENADDA